jgi:spermidine synthase
MPSTPYRVPVPDRPRRKDVGGPSRKARKQLNDTREPLPVGPQPTTTGTVEIVPDPDNTRSVMVLVNGVPSSFLDLDDPTWLEFEYMQQMAAAIDLLPPGPLSVVHLGAGACALPRWVEATRPGSAQLAVDVDTALLTLVRQWFDLPRSPRLRLRSQDARAAVAGLPTGSVDVVVRDVFAGEVTPRHLTSAEFLRDAHRALRPGGLYVANCADRPPLTLARAEVATAREVFADVALAAEPGQLKGRRYGNLVLMATPASKADGSQVDLGSAALARRLRSLPVPVRLLHGEELAAFASDAAPLRDAGQPWRDGSGRDPGEGSRPEPV